MNVPNDSIKDHMETIASVVSLGSGAVLEIGTYDGTGSTQAIRAGFEKAIDSPAMRGGRLWVSVDIRDAIPLWLRPRFPWWHMVVGDSRSGETAAKVIEIAGSGFAGFDLIFIDTDHTYPVMSAELKTWAPLAKAGACAWLFHDTWMHGRYNTMTDAIKEFAASTGLWKYEDVSKACHGLGALYPSVEGGSEHVARSVDA